MRCALFFPMRTLLNEDALQPSSAPSSTSPFCFHPGQQQGHGWRSSVPAGCHHSGIVPCTLSRRLAALPCLHPCCPPARQGYLATVLSLTQDQVPLLCPLSWPRHLGVPKRSVRVMEWRGCAQGAAEPLSADPQLHLTRNTLLGCTLSAAP